VDSRVAKGSMKGGVAVALKNKGGTLRSRKGRKSKSGKEFWFGGRRIKGDGRL